MKRNIPRRTFDENVVIHDGINISATVWKDNKIVTLCSTCVGAEPATMIERYDRHLKEHVKISCPNVVREYNASMGGVDNVDSYVGRFHICINSRKWYIRLVYHLLDMSFINAWFLYKKV